MAQDELSPELVCAHVPHKVTPLMNDMLDKLFTEEEVEKALFQMAPGKAPGVDGFNAGFFQAHWEMLRPCVVPAVLNFLNGGELSEKVNKTLLVLIPKVSNPQDLSQYRPISLCNVLYKICLKTMANRMRTILDEVVSEEQSAFVPGRLITDNVLIAYECIHHLKKKKGKIGECAIKLDMAKAYDRVEWRYLEAVMKALGFSEQWCNLVMKCVTTVSFSVCVNGVFSETFKPTRGIRQGDPISPYLLLLCAEGLSSMIKSIGPQYISRGVRVSRHSPWISHLLFADDCLVITQATKRGLTWWQLFWRITIEALGSWLTRASQQSFLVSTTKMMQSKLSMKVYKSRMKHWGRNTLACPLMLKEGQAEYSISCMGGCVV
jgi:hypothetical protein